MTTTNSRDIISGLQDAIRENPVSASLIGMGLLWMVTGGSRITAAAALLPSAARATASGLGGVLGASADAASSVTGGVRSAVSRLVDGVSHPAASGSEDASSAASQADEAAKETVPASRAHAASNNAIRWAGDAAGSLQANLKETFERQPLLLGAIGLAIGAGMAAAAPPTQIEADYVGEAADQFKEQAKDFATAGVERVTEVAQHTLDAVKDEAAAQGFTPRDAKEGVIALGQKIKTVAATVIS